MLRLSNLENDTNFQYSIIFSRISTLLDRTRGTILYKGGERDRADLFIPPTILDCQSDDAFMEDEVRILKKSSLESSSLFSLDSWKILDRKIFFFYKSFLFLVSEGGSRNLKIVFFRFSVPCSPFSRCSHLTKLLIWSIEAKNRWPPTSSLDPMRRSSDCTRKLAAARLR